MSYRSALGLSKDGYPIYSPMYKGSDFYDYCDVDICNGLKINGSDNYSYVTTYFHPYIMGCFGEGSGNSSSEKKLYQKCSGNPRNCGGSYKAASKLNLNFGILALSGLIASTQLY